MVQRVYSGNRLFQNVSELKAKIQEVWENLAPELIENLFKIMPERCSSVIKNKGHVIDF